MRTLCYRINHDNTPNLCGMDDRILSSVMPAIPNEISHCPSVWYILLSVTDKNDS
jgi:hypothetical protein